MVHTPTHLLSGPLTLSTEYALILQTTLQQRNSLLKQSGKSGVWMKVGYNSLNYNLSLD